MSKVVKWTILAVAAVCITGIVSVLYLAGRDYGDYFSAPPGNIESETEVFHVDSVFRHEWLTLESARGIKTECGMLVPAAERKGARYPAVILLGGKATGKHAIDYALNIRDVIVVAPDYPYDPRESYTAAEFLYDVPGMRRAALSMVPAVRLVTDYLWQRPDVDTNKLILLGYSFGAPFMPCVAAYDRRPAAVALVFGGGDLGGLIRHNVRRYRGGVESWIAGTLGGALLRPLEPLRYAGRISPRPLIMINGTEDEQVPGKYAMELFESAREPKKIIWLDARHVNPKNPELTRRIVDTLKSELAGLKLISPEN